MDIDEDDNDEDENEEPVEETALSGACDEVVDVDLDADAKAWSAEDDNGAAVEESDDVFLLRVS